MTSFESYDKTGWWPMLPEWSIKTFGQKDDGFGVIWLWRRK